MLPINLKSEWILWSKFLLNLSTRYFPEPIMTYITRSLEPRLTRYNFEWKLTNALVMVDILFFFNFNNFFELFAVIKFPLKNQAFNRRQWLAILLYAWPCSVNRSILLSKSDDALICSNPIRHFSSFFVSFVPFGFSWKVLISDLSFFHKPF